MFHCLQRHPFGPLCFPSDLLYHLPPVEEVSFCFCFAPISLTALVPAFLWLRDPSLLIVLQGIGLWSLSPFLPLFLTIPWPFLALSNRTFQSQAKRNWDGAPENPLYLQSLETESKKSKGETEEYGSL